MSDLNFSNPKVALGFSGVVVAIALVASVAVAEFSPNTPAAQLSEEAEQANEAPRRAEPSQNAVEVTANVGWADTGEISDDWGTSPNNSSSDKPEVNDFAPAAAGASGNASPSQGPLSVSRPDPNGPTIRSGAAPGAPPLPWANPGPQTETVVED